MTPPRKLCAMRWQRYTSTVPRAATRAMLAIALAVAAPARADDASDLAKAGKLLAKIDDSKLANTDYVAWLRGMVALRLGEPDAAEPQFKKIGKVSRFAPQVAWRLADCAWARG